LAGKQVPGRGQSSKTGRQPPPMPVPQGGVQKKGRKRGALVVVPPAAGRDAQVML